jgi:hypothetical protein
MVLRANATRLAILTFADKNVETVLNYISEDTQISECELFREKGVWESKLVWNKRSGEEIRSE